MSALHTDEKGSTPLSPTKIEVIMSYDWKDYLADFGRSLKDPRHFKNHNAEFIYQFKSSPRCLFRIHDISWTFDQYHGAESSCEICGKEMFRWRERYPYWAEVNRRKLRAKPWIIYSNIWHPIRFKYWEWVANRHDAQKD